ncbi:hypothetical protein GSI_13130 [Ganoderma sinense ZZ0214-1]|uniref:Uncharacterized protein n=1 Tax=Ganoderma sinense ZZ0214-1 TaxID=1077348 RepID=A0A2G8RUQ6_9APHY|nr:hypothetical protein GSI_13130 [Ganoderma sinense ZZ0214-1]
MPPAQTDWRRIDLLDPQQPLPNMYFSMPQTSLPPEMQRPDFLSDNMPGNHGSAPRDETQGPERSPFASQGESPDPPNTLSQANVRVFPCLLFELEPGTAGTFVHPDVPIPGRLKLVVGTAELDHWVSLVTLGAGSTLAARTSDKGKGPQKYADVVIPPAQDNLRATLNPSSTSMRPPTSAPPPAAVPIVSGWREEPNFEAQPTYSGPQPPMSANPMSMPALLPQPQFNQGPVPTSSYPGPSDSLCTPAAASIPAAPHYHDSPPSLARPPPPISHTANLDLFRSSAPPHVFHLSSFLNTVPQLVSADPQPSPEIYHGGAALETPVDEGQFHPGAQARRPMGEPGGHARTHQPHGRGRS